MKRTGLEHPKLRRLSRRLGVPRWGAVGLLECLWGYVARFAPNKQDERQPGQDDEDPDPRQLRHLGGRHRIAGA